MTTLRAYLAAWSAERDDRRAVVATLSSIAEAAASLSAIIAQGPRAGDPLQAPDRVGDDPNALDRHANALFLAHLRTAPVAVVASEEVAAVVVLQPGAPIAVAIDPLDGVNNLAVNAPLGTVFSLLPAGSTGLPGMAFLAPGDRQFAAGFVLYGPYTALVLTLLDGVHIFTLDRQTSEFVLTRRSLRIPCAQREYAINASNVRHWPLAIRAFVEECVAGEEGPRGVDYNTRWLGAVVAEAYRILVQGGIYLYPGDARPGYRRGRLRLLYEVNPIALLVEQAGGTATDGYGRILDVVPSDIHERAPLIFGSPDKVERVMELYADGVPQAGQRPLFAARGLFKS